MLYDLRERLDPYIRDRLPLSVPIRKPKAIWAEPVLQAEIACSSLTAENRLRAPVYKGIREDRYHGNSRLLASGTYRVPYCGCGPQIYSTVAEPSAFGTHS